MFACLALVLAAAPPPVVSAPLSNIRYDVTFTRELAQRRHLGVGMEFDVAGPGDVVLSLPAWTPGAYEMTWFARWVSKFSPTANGKELSWDKVDYDTWRIRTGGARHVRVTFDFQADSLDNAMAWSRDEFAFFNGTNVFLYPEGRSLLFPATVRVTTESDWRVATSMHPGPEPGSYTEKNFHDLVDMPFFVGRFDLDSATVDGTNLRLATYPAGMLTGAARSAFWEQYRTMFAPQGRVFGEVPFAAYTTLMVFDSAFGGGSALEHQSSHLGIYTPAGIGQTWLASVTAHEITHAWNVKRLRPSEMVPYRYDVPEPTPWLWVSEGITDYYADLVLLRGGVVDSAGFLEQTGDKIRTVKDAPPVALEDASLSTWIHPTDGTGYLYYPKGSLAGFLLDIMIRDASNNRHGLDDVMRELYRTTYKAGRGFGGADWWGAVRRAAGGKDLSGFNRRYVDDRIPFPLDSVLPLAGLRLITDSVRVPRLGIESRSDSTGSTVTNVAPGSAAAQAGVQVGDLILALGDIPVKSEDAFQQFRDRYATQEGAALPIRVKRGAEELTLNGTVRLLTLTNDRLTIDPDASLKAVRVRHGVFSGSTGE
ncbi:MAG TPA: PDZ domain-containing protein [Gemmatimonadales bacterium]|nr:PDZ domain-containing protein [Gemmatimonadales bacterium]